MPEATWWSVTGPTLTVAGPLSRAPVRSPRWLQPLSVVNLEQPLSKVGEGHLDDAGAPEAGGCVPCSSFSSPTFTEHLGVCVTVGKEDTEMENLWSINSQERPPMLS